MTRRYRIDPAQDLPIITVKLSGKGRIYKAKVIFDSGAACTQFDTLVIDRLGYSAADGHALASAHGPAGPIQEGYLIKIDELTVLGKRFSQPIIAAYDFDNLENLGIDGLLGYDIIKQLHFELDGPKSSLTVFDE